VRFALRSGADAICEKPLVLNPWNIDGLREIEQSTGRKVNTILQLRLHPSIIALKERVAANGQDRKHEVDLTYITSRGRWYYASWKGDEQKSGGIATNIGVHFYDMLTFVFGPLQESYVHHRAADCASGYLEYENARGRWFLSINRRDLPQNIPAGQTTFRSITIDGEELEFSGGFTDLHTQSYEQIIADNGFDLDEARPSIETVSSIRSATVDPSKGEQHPFLSSALDDQRYRNGYPV
jgi:UDP-N-acetyl-2-amino-2-deoxyglucuronate dehydrogenase